MLLGGDEVRRTQGGNNNAYCQDNATSWFNWAQVGENREIHRFARDLIAFRATHPVLSKEEFYSDAEIQWLGQPAKCPDRRTRKEKQLGCLIAEDGEAALLNDVQTGVRRTPNLCSPHHFLSPIGRWCSIPLEWHRKTRLLTTMTNLRTV